MSRRKKIVVEVEKDPPPETLGVFSESEVESRKNDRPAEEKEGAPPDAEDKIRMAKQKHTDDGRPARRKLHTLRGQSGYRVDEDSWNGKERAPVLVSIFCMDTRTYWRRADELSVSNPMMELARRVPESPPIGSQWHQAT